MLVRPDRLKPGDLVAVIAPSSPFDRDRFVQGVKRLEEWGYRVEHRPDLFDRKDYLAGSDDRRRTEIHEFLARSDVKALIAARGGYGTMRLLDSLDYREIRRTRKLWLGFSDLTALHLAIMKKSRLVTFHSPMVGSLLDAPPAMQELFRSRLEGSAGPDLFPGKADGLARGRVEGWLMPANLTLLTSLVGTPYRPNLTGALLLLEDVNEDPYKIDRMVTQLRLAGCLDGVAGFALGQFTRPDQTDSKDRERLNEDVYKVFLDLNERLKLPMIAHCPFGHVSANATIPRGIPARLDAGKGRITMLMPCVM